MDFVLDLIFATVSDALVAFFSAILSVPIDLATDWLKTLWAPAAN